MTTQETTMNATTTTPNPAVGMTDPQAFAAAYTNGSLMEAMGHLLYSVGEALRFDVSRTGEDTFRIVLTLSVPGIEAGAKGNSEPFKSLIEGYEQARSLLVKPLVFSGTMSEIEAEMRAFVEQGGADEVREARTELTGVADKVRKLLEEAEKKSSKKPASKAKSAGGKKSCSTGECGAGTAKSESAKEKPKEPPAPQVPDLFT